MSDIAIGCNVTEQHHEAAEQDQFVTKVFALLVSSEYRKMLTNEATTEQAARWYNHVVTSYDSVGVVSQLALFIDGTRVTLRPDGTYSIVV